VIAVNEASETTDQAIGIVIVEDSSVQAETLKRMLVKEGYAVSVARNGVEGLAMVKDTLPDLVVSDIMMPEMSGFDLCSHIKNDGCLGDIPVILLTSLNDPKDVIRGLECRADNFITKPFDEKYLLSRIKYILLSRELHHAEQMDLGIEIYFAGQKYYINSDRQQILSLLLSTYETAVQKNNELLQTQEVLKELNERLEERVAERTASLQQEILERMRAEDAKSRLYEELKDLYNNAPCGYHSIDAEGSFTGINDTELAWLGYAREEIIGRKRFIDIISPLSRDVYTRTLNTSRKNGPAKDMELDLVRKDGTILNALLSESAVLDPEGNLVNSRVTVFDVTERKKLEEQLRQSQKMEAIGLLAGGVAHDFNNILTVIYGYCAILQSKMGEDSPFRPEMDHIHAAAERAARLTRSLLAFSREQIMTAKQVDLNDIVRNVWQLLSRIIGEDIHLETMVAEKPLWILADSVQIEQVLMNLAANARDAMPNGGQLTIETEEREIDEGFMQTHGFCAPGKYAVVSLSDNGTGMDAETSNKIFEPFFTTKEVGMGTGLGLSIVYGVIKQHNGSISVYSEPGMGTTFRIYLPITDAEHLPEEKGLSLPPKGGSETILCAEDDDVIRGLVTQILTSYGYNVITSENGADAVARFMEQKDEIDLLLFDLIMPKKNGKEASEEIRKLNPGVRTLFMTGYPSDLLQKRGMLEDSHDAIMKPISPMDLLRKVREVLDR
jgi:PAS domain S-box-containing protein